MSQQADLAKLFAAEFLAGKSYASIVEARSQAAQLLNQPVRPGSPLAKLVDESVEAGLVRAAKKIIGESEDALKAYADLVDLTDRQPRLGVRSSTSCPDRTRIDVLGQYYQSQLFVVHPYQLSAVPQYAFSQL